MIPLLLALACGSSEPPRPPDLVLVTLDTTRADAVGAYGQSPSPTPRLDALAADGVRFDEAMTVTPLTLPAHASILTGLWPDRHGVRDNSGYALDGEHVTLPERLRDAGYATGAFVAAIVLDSTFGLDQGFDAYVDGFDLTNPDDSAAWVVQWPGPTVRERTTAWIDRTLEARPDAPLFVWMHLYEPHQPLDPPAHLRALHGDPYLAEIASADEQLGALLDHLASRGRDPVVAVLADHGEGRGDHGETLHGTFVYRSTMRVPFVLRMPGGSAHTVPQPVSVADLAPTFLALAGLPVPDDLDGVDLAPALRGEPVPTRPVYGESFHGRLSYGLSELRVVQDASRRYILAPREELYDWTADPGERTDLSAREPTETWRSWILAREADRVEPGEAVLQEQLAALGYVAGLSTVASDVPFHALPDPKDAPDLVARFETLVIDARTRPPAEAVPLLEAFLVDHPDVGAARQLLARARHLSGDRAGAIAELGRLLVPRPTDPGLRTMLAELLLEDRAADQAVPLLEAVVADRPDWPSAWALLGEHHRRTGDCGAAVRAVESGLAHSPEASRLLLVRGACRSATGDPMGAEIDLRTVLHLDPENDDVRFLLGTLLARGGRTSEALPLLEEQARRTPDAPLARAALGMALYASGRLEDAVPHLKAASPHAEVGDEPPLLLADVLLRTGGSDAERWLALAEERNPANPQIAGVRSRLPRP